MKRLLRDVARCEDCPFFNQDYRGCSEADEIVPEDIAIPDWCPLPDADGELSPEELEDELAGIAESVDLG